MTPTRWQEIERVYHAALERPPTRRDEFLTEACKDDSELRREVESLLAHHTSKMGALDQPAWVGVDGLTAFDATVTMMPPATRLGLYTIEGLLGKGGMGVVYRARDTKLKREVAIKILSNEFSRDPDRVNRFQREAEVLASLNHSNIAAIHSFEEADGVRFLVLELVAGETLAERIKRGPIPVDVALTIAKQICEALEAAHEKGIVHRDLKPANVKITPDGVIKVLDFGLAKVVAGASGSDLTQSTALSIGTADGVILGTVAYMSPEQARGRRVDKRTDIWAFGCVLFEMLTGRIAFDGNTISDTLAAVLEHEPAWDALPASTPITMRRLLHRCLTKDPKYRLRDIGDALHEIDPAVAETDPEGGSVESGRRLPRRAAAGLILAAAISVGIVADRYLTSNGDSAGSAAPSFTRIVRLTSGPARESGPVISPDGKWVAYLSDAGGTSNVWVRFIAGGDASNLTAQSGLEIQGRTIIGGLDISPDGTMVSVQARTRGSTGPFTVWLIPAPLPGVPRKLLESAGGARWSPDGRKLAFVHPGSTSGDALEIANADGTDAREVVPLLGGRHLHWPAWSHDGRYLYFIYTGSSFNEQPSEVFRVASTGGPIERVIATTRRALFPYPLPNGSGIVYAADPSSAELGLWWTPQSPGEPRRLTTGVGEYAEVRPSLDGRAMVATFVEPRQSLVRISVGDGAMQSVTSGYTGDLNPTLVSKSNVLAFSSSRAGNRNIWISELDGATPRPVTAGPSMDDQPALSPDGRQIAFVSDRDGKRAIWVVGRDGGTPRLVGPAAVTDTLSWSPDGTRIAFAEGSDSGPHLWMMNVADGKRTRIPTPDVASAPAWSPVDNVIAYIRPPIPQDPQASRLAFVTSDGHPQFEGLAAGMLPNNGSLAWSSDGRRLALISVITSAPASVWIVELDGRPPRRLAVLPSGPFLRGATWAADSSAVFVGVHDWISDVVLFDQKP